MRIEKEIDETSQLESELANVCFTLQHYESVFADCATLLGAKASTANYDELIDLLVKLLRELRESNAELESQMVSLRQPIVARRPKRPSLSAIAAQEVWGLYDQVMEKLESTDKLKREIRDFRLQQTKENCLSYAGTRAAKPFAVSVAVSSPQCLSGYMAEPDTESTRDPEFSAGHRPVSPETSPEISPEVGDACDFLKSVGNLENLQGGPDKKKRKRGKRKGKRAPALSPQDGKFQVYEGETGTSVEIIIS